MPHFWTAISPTTSLAQVCLIHCSFYSLGLPFLSIYQLLPVRNFLGSVKFYFLHYGCYLFLNFCLFAHLFSVHVYLETSDSWWIHLLHACNRATESQIWAWCWNAWIPIATLLLVALWANNLIISDFSFFIYVLRIIIPIFDSLSVLVPLQSRPE